jgi:uncharacterized phage protein (TIGR02220 family)
MKRTITLTAEDLSFIDRLSRDEALYLINRLRDRLQGIDFVPPNRYKDEYDRLDKLTVPVKTAALGTSEVCQLCADRLNGLLGTKFRPNAQSMKTHVSARLREGYKQEDFLAVIDKKVAEWKGTDMERYLRPETIFGPKFEGYLNQSIPNAANPPEVNYAEGL